MKEYKTNNAITLVALVITITVLLIFAGITITAGSISIEKYTDKKLQTELKMVQSVIIVQYEKYSMVRDSSLLIGNKCDIDGTLNNNGEYYLLTPQELEELGMKNPKDTYVVNYETGEVINNTTKTKSDGTELKLNTI